MTMTNPKVRRPSRRGHSTTDKVVSASLAVAACAGLVGVIAVRTSQDAEAASAKAASQAPDATLAAATTSNGLTQDQLDQYAAQLESERQKLLQYRDQLALAAAALNGSDQSSAVPSAKSGAAIKTPTAKKSTAKAAVKKAHSKSKAKAKAKVTVTAPAQPQAQAPQQSAPQAQAAPQPQAQIQPQQAPRPQGHSRAS